ncbi:MULTISPECIES: hypothetical protein [Kitasatospora]
MAPDLEGPVPVLTRLWRCTPGLQFPDGVVVYGPQDLPERNETYEVGEYQPDWVLIGDDSGGRGLFMRRAGGDRPSVYSLGLGDGDRDIDRPGVGEWVTDDLLGWLTERLVRQRYVTVSAADQELTVGFDGADLQAVAELLPRAREVLADFAALRQAGAEFLWGWGAEGGEPEEEKTHFLEAVTATALVAERAGGFTVNFEDSSGTYCQEGYWYAVRFRGDRTPFAVTREA